MPPTATRATPLGETRRAMMAGQRQGASGSLLPRTGLWHTEPGQAGREGLTLRLQPRRQPELRAKSVGGLIDREAGAVGRDLEQHAAGLGEVALREIAAVPHRRHAQPFFEDLQAPPLLGLLLRRSPRDVV